MKKLYIISIAAVLLLIGTAVFAGNYFYSSATTKDEAARISLEDAKKDFDENAAVFVDTRPADAYKEEHIKGAINLPAADVEARYKELPKDKKIIAYCS